MPNYADRIAWVSHEGSDLEIDAQTPDWTAIEEILQKQISDDLRQKLVEICNNYLSLRTAEISAAKVSDVCNHAKIIRKKLDGFFQFTSGRYPDSKSRQKDSYVEFEHRFETMLAQHAIPIDNDRLFPNEEPPESVAEYMRDNPLVLSLRPHDLMNIIVNINAVLAKIEQGQEAIGSQVELQGFKNGEAFSRFIGRCRSWAMLLGLPHGGYTAKGKPSRLAAAVFEICMALPKEANPNIASVGAMADHLKNNPPIELG